MSGKAPKAPISTRGRGRPKSQKTIEAEAEREAWERSSRMPAVEAFPKGSGFDKLAAAGVIAVPDPPTQRRRGGQKKLKSDDEVLAWWAEYFKSTLKLKTDRQAIACVARFLQDREIAAQPGARLKRLKEQRDAVRDDTAQAERLSAAIQQLEMYGRNVRPAKTWTARLNTSGGLRDLERRIYRGKRKQQKKRSK